MRKVIRKRSGSRLIHKKPPELSLQSGEAPKGHCSGLGALETWPRSWRPLSVRPWFPGWGWEPFQSMHLGEHNLPHEAVIRYIFWPSNTSQGTTRNSGSTLVWLFSSPAVSPERGSQQQPNCRGIRFDFYATWTVRMASCPLILFYCPSWAWLLQVMN